MQQTTPVVTTGLVGKASKSVAWELPAWSQNHTIIAACQAGCLLEVGNHPDQVSLEFFLQPFKKDWRDVDGSSFILQGYSLCAKVLKSFGNIAAIKVSASASQINYLYQGNSAIGEGVVNTKSKGKSVVVIEEFIHLEPLSYHSNYGSKYGQYRVPVAGGFFKKSQSGALTVTITATTFSLSEPVSGDKQGVGLQEEEKEKIVEAEVSMIDHLKRMYAAESNFSDLKLESKDNMTLSGHRFVLAARSPYFRRAIENAVKKDGFDGTLKVAEVNGKPLTMILEWVYTGELNENAGRFMEELVDAAIKFEMTGLLKVLDKKLITICTVDNMFRLHQVANNNAMPTAIENIAAFIKENI